MDRVQNTRQLEGVSQQDDIFLLVFRHENYIDRPGSRRAHDLLSTLRSESAQ